MNNLPLCALTLVLLCGSSPCFDRDRQGEEKRSTSARASQILWQFDTGG